MRRAEYSLFERNDRQGSDACVSGRAHGDFHYGNDIVDLKASERDELETLACKAVEISFCETTSGGAMPGTMIPIPRFVLILRATLQFETRSGETFVINPGDILLAQDQT
jgi:hypothetical protein